MKILLAKDAGYCFGVRDAVDMAYDTSKEYGEVYMLGDIVHNENVVEDLEKSGVKVVSDLEDIPDDKPVLFRAHGTAKNVWKDAENKKMNIIDATCPLVHEIHREVKQLHEEGRKIIDLSLGQSDFKSPKQAVDAAIQALKDGHHGYSLPNGMIECRLAVSRKIKNLYKADVDPERIVIMPGGKPTMSFAISFFVKCKPYKVLLLL